MRFEKLTMNCVITLMLLDGRLQFGLYRYLQLFVSH